MLITLNGLLIISCILHMYIRQIMNTDSHLFTVGILILYNSRSKIVYYVFDTHTGHSLMDFFIDHGFINFCKWTKKYKDLAHNCNLVYPQKISSHYQSTNYILMYCVWPKFVTKFLDHMADQNLFIIFCSLLLSQLHRIHNEDQDV